MSGPIIVVVLLAPADPTAEPMLAATRGALADAQVIANQDGVKTDAEALAAGNAAHARAVATVTWSDTEHAHLHVHVDTWADDDLAFSPNDPPTEKGRAVGFTLASMVERLDRAAPPPPPIAEVPIVVPPPPEPPSKPHRFEAFALGIGTLGGDAHAAGGAVGARWIAPFGFGARVMGSLAAGPVADGHSVSAAFGGGPTYDVMVTDAFELGGRLDVTATHLAVVYGNASHTRWLGATALVAEAAYFIGPRFGIAAGIGPELAFGGTNVRVNGGNVADLPHWRALGELGLRIRL